jgi:hypothetical protein
METVENKILQPQHPMQVQKFSPRGFFRWIEIAGPCGPQRAAWYLSTE